MTILPLHCEIPVGLQRDARGKCDEQHVDVCDDYDGKQDLAGETGPLEGEDVDVKQQDGHLGEAQREEVEDDAVPSCL